MSKHWSWGLAGLAVVGGLTFAATRASSPQPPKSVLSLTAKTNLNRASIVELESLPGVGPKIAVDIMQHRPYKSGADLMVKVRAMRRTLWEHLKDRVRF